MLWLSQDRLEQTEFRGGGQKALPFHIFNIHLSHIGHISLVNFLYQKGKGKNQKGDRCYVL